MQEFSALLEIGLTEVYKDDLPTHKVLYKAWLRERTAKEFTEDSLVTTGLGPMPAKGVGAPFITDKPFISNPKDFVMLTYGLGFVAEYELIRWDKYSVFTGITKKLARSGTDRKNIIAHAILNNSFSTADPVYTTYANEALCANSHTLLRGGTGKNAPSSPVGLSYLGIQEAITDYDLLVNEDGLYVMLDASLLICHPQKKWIARTLLESDYRPDNANMNKNTIKSEVTSYHCSPYLTSATAWWLVADKSHLKMTFDIGDDLHFRRDFDFATWNNVFSMYGSWRVNVLHWHGLWGTPGV